MSYMLGTKVRCEGKFRDDAGRLVDPSTVRFLLERPNGTEDAALVYGTDAAVVKVATGRYRVDVDPDQTGDYTYRFESDGSYKTADEESFSVEAGAFAD